MNILKELDELTKAEVISPGTADHIRTYYKQKGQDSGSKLFIVFGILGAILVGLGLILIIAHNWDDLSKNIKVVIAYLPLVIAQLLCVYSLLKRSDSSAWREASSAFLVFAVGASISLVSQVYNIHGDLASFLFTWMLLCLPVIYLMRSSVASLLYIVGITYYCCESNYFFSWGRSHTEVYHYWWMLLLALPHYYQLIMNRPDSNFTVFHNWLVPLSLIICLGTIAHHYGDLMYISYISLFGLFYLFGTSKVFSRMKRPVNGYVVFSSLGTTQILLMLSFHEYWQQIGWQPLNFYECYGSAEAISIYILVALALGLFIFQNRKGITGFHPMKGIFLPFIFIFITGTAHPNTAVALINLLILATGIMVIRHGVVNDHLGILNYGLLTVTALVICRFFDSNISFVIRGLLFMLVGVGFFVANFLMIKKRKQTQ
jgi:uncharacterized membrane protein